MILSRSLRKKSPFRHSIAPNIFPFNACRAYSNGRDLGNAADTNNELRKHRVHRPLLLAENLGRDQSAINKGHIQTCCTIVSVVVLGRFFRYIIILFHLRLFVAICPTGMERKTHFLQTPCQKGLFLSKMRLNITKHVFKMKYLLLFICVCTKRCICSCIHK